MIVLGLVRDRRAITERRGHRRPGHRLRQVELPRLCTARRGRGALELTARPVRVRSLAGESDGVGGGRNRQRHHCGKSRYESCTTDGETTANTSTTRGIRLLHDRSPFW